MPLTDNSYTFTQAVWSLLDANKGTITSVSGLTIQTVWFSDQDRYPTTPCLSVEPGQKARTYKGVPRVYNVMLECYATVYVERITDTQQNRRDTLQLAESTEAVLHADATLGGLVVDSYTSQGDPGYVQRSGTLLSALRLTFTARSEARLPNNP